MNIGFLKKFFFGCLPLLLVGCCPVLPRHNAAPYRVVTQIQVVYESGSLETQRQIFHEEKMRPILDYLRYLDPYGRPQEDPEQVSGNDCCITLCYSDGSQRNYRQRADRYLSVDNSPWQRIDQTKAMELKMLVWMIPSDPIPVHEAPAPSLIQPQI